MIFYTILIQSEKLVQRLASLLLNENKCESIINDNKVVSSIQTIMPNIVHIPCNDAVLLGAPFGDETAVDTAGLVYVRGEHQHFCALIRLLSRQNPPPRQRTCGAPS